jgi:hypothetical protein
MLFSRFPKRLVAIAVYFLAAMDVSPAGAVELERLTQATLSDDTDGIRKVIAEVAAADLKDPEVAWRTLNAYFRYFDELAERNREKDRQWAADAMYELAKVARKAHPDHAGVRYWSAMAGLSYLQTYQMKALFVAGDVMDEMEVVRKLQPELDDWGPDRVLGILYYNLPGWPLSRGDNDKALVHLAKAAQAAPHRAVNRLYYAKTLWKDNQKEKAKGELGFLQKGEWKVSSAHWRKITEKQIGELAEEMK